MPHVRHRENALRVQNRFKVFLCVYMHKVYILTYTYKWKYLLIMLINYILIENWLYYGFLSFALYHTFQLLVGLM